ncbi:MAG: carbohydrate-binding protein [Gammaproteobacteria bacterium]|nr:MAG: carbohydrate-binding protein [Gammaproteobacteria bacterium]
MNNFTKAKQVATAKLAILASLMACAGAPVMADVLNPVIGPLLYEENFNNLDSNVWNSIDSDGCSIGLCGWGNQELEYYRPGNLSIDDVPFELGTKALAIQARREGYGGKPFTSGKITTEGKLQVKYGLIEFRLSTPQVGTGLWPAGWMLGTTLATWPAKGELDIMEMGHKLSSMIPLGSDINSYTASNAIFYAAAACVPGNESCAASTAWQTKNSYVASTPLTNRFVTYRMYWTDSQIRFTVVDNGVEHDMYAAPIPVGGESSEFQAPFYFLFNLAVGGNFTDAASESQVTAPLPSKMYIDYVRVYQLNGLGEVKLGNQTPKQTGTFGVFSDANTTDKQELGGSADLWVWNQTSVAPGTATPYEGSNVIAWNYTAPQWFGAGIASRQVRDMSNFGNGTLKFRIKIPANVGFKIGIADTYTNESWINFPANATTYGLVRNGDWAQATIPISAIRGINALQSMSQLFMIASLDPQPTANFPIAIDDIVWDCGTDAACASTGSSSSTSSTGTVVSSNSSSKASSASVASSSVASSRSSSSVVVASSSVSSKASSSSSSATNTSFEWFAQAESFIATSGVQVIDAQDVGGGKSVDNVGAGNWIAYTGLTVPTAGTYTIEYRVASPVASQLSADLNGGSIILGNLDIPATGGNQNWVTLTQTVTLPAGSFNLGIFAQQGGWSLNWFRIIKGTTTASSSVASTSSSSVAGSAASSTASSASSADGYTVLSNTSVNFYANNAQWVDIHYIINNEGQQNIRMTHNGDNTNVYTLTGIPAGATVKYFFTVGPLVGGAFDSPWQTFSIGATSSSSSSAAPLQCDFNGSKTVDLTDIDLILARKNTPAIGNNDPYDVVKDGVINVLDSRACVLKCTKAACAR